MVGKTVRWSLLTPFHTLGRVVGQAPLEEWQCRCVVSPRAAAPLLLSTLFQLASMYPMVVAASRSASQSPS